MDLEDTDDLEVIIQASALPGREGQTNLKNLYKNLFQLVCCLAGESVNTESMST